jgi:O-antigen/teichoic acid export membrane protein
MSMAATPRETTTSGTGAAAPESASDVFEEALEAPEIKRRAVGGAVLVGLRGVGIQALAFGANIVLARLLAPHAFGLVAIGNTIVTFGDLMATQGAATTLIRNPTTPQLADLRAVAGFQLAVTGLITAGTVAIALQFGMAGRLAAVMSLALPLLSLRSPPAVMLERSLAYRKLVAVEITENVVYYAWAIGTVVAGFGVWGLATGVLVRIVAGTVVINSIGPVGWLRPSWAWSRLRPVLGFGVRLQATVGLNFARDQLINVAIAAETTIATVGLWSLAYRALSIPMLLFDALWRVAYPAITRLMAIGENTRTIVERSMGMVATAGTAPLCALAAAAPAFIPGVFGARWSGAADVLPAACLGLIIVGPISVSSGGFLGAHGDAKTILKGAFLHTIAQFAVAMPLLPFLHLWGVGLGILAACLVEAVVLGRRSQELTGARVVRSITGPVAAGVIAGVGGWIFAHFVGHTLAIGIAAAALTTAGYVLLLALVPGNMLLPTLRMMRQAIGAAK